MYVGPWKVLNVSAGTTLNLRFLSNSAHYDVASTIQPPSLAVGEPLGRQQNNVEETVAIRLSDGRRLHSSTFRLNICAVYGVFKGCLWCFEGISFMRGGGV
jgi:hypothetical protein